jgi:conjugative relaxase-like TrwC/TraI family protein
MITLQGLTAQGNNAHGDAVLDYLLATEALTAYYVGPEGMTQATMRWRGRGAQVLGLTHEPTRAAMAHLARGFAPDGVTALCRNAGAEPVRMTKTDRHGRVRRDAQGSALTHWQGGHRVGFDLTCSAPKSVSVLLALAEPAERGRILDAHRAAVDAVLLCMESMVETRRGKAGREVIPVQGLVITACDHLANRNLDPQLHTHSLIFGVAQGVDGHWSTFDPVAMFEHQQAGDAIYKAHLAQRLRAIGYGIAQQAVLDLDGNDTGRRMWEVAGIDEVTIRHFATRDAEIRAAMAKGMNHHDAWRTTRKHKDEPSPGELFAHWHERLLSLGQNLDIDTLKRCPDRRADAQSDDAILRALHQHEAIVEDKDVLLAVSQARAGNGADQLLADVQRLKSMMMPIAPAPVADADRTEHLPRRHTRTRYAARWMVDWEDDVQQRADARRAETTCRVPLTRLAAIIERYQVEKGFVLSAEQYLAVRHLCTESGGHAVLAGVAGAGKTTVAKLYRRAFEANGQHLIGVSSSTRAAQKLHADSGMTTMSLAMLLTRLDHGRITLDAKTVVVLDEAGMVHTEALRRLMRQVDHVGAKLILQGDMKQLQPIGAGNGMALVAESVGQATLTEVRRQRHDEDRAVARLFYDTDREGRIVLTNDQAPRSRQAVQAKSQAIWRALEARHQIDAYDTQDQAMDALVHDWFDSDYTVDHRLVLIHTHDDGQAITERLRAGLRERGLIEEEQYQVVGRQGDKRLSLQIARGDRLRITENEVTLGLTHGDLGEVVAIHPKVSGGHHLHVRILAKDGREPFLVNLDTAAFPHFNHGYVDTIHQSQGQGKPAVFHYVNPRMTDNAAMLVAFTRMTHQYRLYGAEEDLMLARDKLGLERVKHNAIQQGLVDTPHSCASTMAHEEREWW